MKKNGHTNRNRKVKQERKPSQSIKRKKQRSKIHQGKYNKISIKGKKQNDKVYGSA